MVSALPGGGARASAQKGELACAGHTDPRAFLLRAQLRALGVLLYDRYFLLFQLAGLILLVAMVGAIVLTHRARVGVRKQSIAAQNARLRSEAVSLKKVEPGQGI